MTSTTYYPEKQAESFFYAGQAFDRLKNFYDYDKEEEVSNYYCDLALQMFEKAKSLNTAKTIEPTRIEQYILDNTRP